MSFDKVEGHHVRQHALSVAPPLLAIPVIPLQPAAFPAASSPSFVPAFPLGPAAVPAVSSSLPLSKCSGPASPALPPDLVAFVDVPAVDPISGTHPFPCDAFGVSPLSPVSAWAAAPCPGTVPIYSVRGSPLCAYVAGGSSLTFLDSGATYHLTGDLSLFTGILAPVDTPVAGIDSASSLRATGFGSIRATLGGQFATLRDAFYVPGLQHTLVSVRGLVRSPGAACTFTAAGVRLDLPELASPVWAPSATGLYTLDNFTSCSPVLDPAEVPLGFYADSRRGRPQPNTFTGQLTLATLLHRRCGHMSLGNRHIASAMKEAFGPKFDRAEAEFCEHCVLAKAHRSRSGLPSVRKALRPLERVHFDISPAIPTMGIGGNKGYLLIVDEFTDKVFIYFLRSKSEVGPKLQVFQRWAERHFQQKLGRYQVPFTLSCFRSDNAMENVSTEVREWLGAEGIGHELSAPYSQWQDGTSERYVRTVWEGSEAMRKAAGAPPRYWPFSLRAFAHAQSFLPRRHAESPYEAWNGISVPFAERIRHLRVWGTRCFFLVPKELRKKLDDKARECLFVGYSSTSKAYVGIEMSTGRILMSPNVIFDETCYPCKDAGFALPVVRAAANLGSNMTELHWVPEPPPEPQGNASPVRPLYPPLASPFPDLVAPSPAPRSPSRLPLRSPLIRSVPRLASPVMSAAVENALPLASALPEVGFQAPSSAVVGVRRSRRLLAQASAPSSSDEDEAYLADFVQPSSLDRLGAPPVPPVMLVDELPGPDLADPLEVSALLAKVQAAQATEIASKGSLIQHVSMEGCPVFSHSLSHGMVLGRLALSLQRPTVLRSALARYDYRFQVLTSAVPCIRPMAMAAVPRIPRHLGDVYRDINCAAWQSAMRAELSNFTTLKVWELVDRPVDRNVMSCKWVFDIKYDAEGGFDKLKARLTCRGFTQVKGQDYEETWAPTCRLRVLRALLALASTNPAFMTAQWDCTAAFLQSDADCEMYMEQPPGFVEGDGRGKVYRLLKSVYGTKQASRLFHLLVRKTLLDLGAVQAKADECLFIFRSEVGEVYVLTHVDDFAVLYTDPELYKRILARMREVFIGGFKDLGPLHKFLGIIIERRTEGGFRLHQTPKILELLQRLGLDDVAPASSPAQAGTAAKLQPLLEPLSEADALFMAAVPYVEAVSSLFYICRASRWDISHACSQVARFMANPGPAHWAAVRRIYGYLRRTATVGLVIAVNTLELEYTNADASLSPRAMRLEGWSDADWAGDKVTRKSHTGWMVRCGGALVSWLSKAQGCISQSTMEAELVAVTALSNEVLWWRILWQDLAIPVVVPVPLWVDNSAAVTLAQHAGRFDATKHIELKYLVVRDHQERDLVKVAWVAGQFQLADVLTKALYPADFILAVTGVMGESVALVT